MMMGPPIMIGSAWLVSHYGHKLLVTIADRIGWRFDDDFYNIYQTVYLHTESYIPIMQPPRGP